MSAERKQVYQVYIQATPDQVWEAITTSRFTTQYYFRSTIESDWKAGSPYTMRNPEGTEVFIDGTVLEAVPGRRLVQTFNARWDPELAGEKETRVTWELEALGDATKLTLTHDGFAADSKLFAGVDDGGWSQILSGMKTVLETGKALVVGEATAAEAAM
jgi:uncharacterized protein YndB with AHSA1/START domain